jgi:hypothetical protein
MEAVVLGWDLDRAVRWVPSYERALTQVRLSGSSTAPHLFAGTPPPPGTTVHLMLQGGTRGLVGRGTVRSAPYLAADVARPGRVATYALVQWDHLLPVIERITPEELVARVPGVQWRTLYASVHRLSAEDAERLDRVWAAPHPSARPGRSRRRAAGPAGHQPGIPDRAAGPPAGSPRRRRRAAGVTVVDMASDPDRAITELIGVYHADGGLVGEAKYVIGHLLGLTHCALCDITHSPVRRKPTWDRMVTDLGVPFTLLHLNEMPPDVAEVVVGEGAPIVLARTRDDRLSPVLSGPDLDGLGGSVDAFAAALRTGLAAQGRWLPPAAEDAAEVG